MSSTRVIVVALGLSIAGFASACSLIVDSDSKKAGSRPVGCYPGAIAACPCENNVSSQQVCEATGKYGPCMCDGAQAGTGG